MKKKSTSQSAFFNPRVLIGLFIVLAGVFLALIGLGTFSGLTASSAQAQQKPKIITNSTTRSFLMDLTVPKFTNWASTSRKTCGLEPS